MRVGAASVVVEKSVEMTSRLDDETSILTIVEFFPSLGATFTVLYVV